MYCNGCGKEIPESTEYCSNCGTKVTPVAPLFQRNELSNDHVSHWINRIIALVIDSLLVAVVTSIAYFVVAIPFALLDPLGFFNWVSFPFAMGLIFILYFTFAEAAYGYTFGKKLLGFKVVTEDGNRPNLETAFLRNVSKIYWVLLLLDVVGGFLTARDPHQKYSDQIVHTTVI